MWGKGNFSGPKGAWVRIMQSAREESIYRVATTSQTLSTSVGRGKEGPRSYRSGKQNDKEEMWLRALRWDWFLELFECWEY